MGWLDGREPLLEEALQDPVIRAVMRRDRIEAEEVRRLARRIGRVLRERRPPGKEAA